MITIFSSLNSSPALRWLNRQDGLTSNTSVIILHAAARWITTTSSIMLRTTLFAPSRLAGWLTMVNNGQQWLLWCYLQVNVGQVLVNNGEQSRRRVVDKGWARIWRQWGWDRQSVKLGVISHSAETLPPSSFRRLITWSLNQTYAASWLELLTQNITQTSKNHIVFIDN